MFPWHLRDQDKEREPIRRRWFAFDTEGNGEKFIGASFAWREADGEVRTYWTTDRADAIGRFYSLGRDGRIAVAHNAMYDLATLFPQPWTDVRLKLVRGRLLDATVGINDGLPGLEPAGGSKKRVSVWDSFGLAPMALAAIGKAVGLPKLATPPSLAPVEEASEPWSCEMHGVEWCMPCYATRDAEIVLRYMELVDDEAVKSGIRLRKRIASVALADWVHNARKLIPRIDPRLNEGWEQDGLPYDHPRTGYRSAYAGGRVEMFDTAEHRNVRVYDVNSMYPYAMLHFPFPDPRSLHIEEANSWNSDLEGVTSCRVHVPRRVDGTLPVLPVKVKGHLYWPTGDFNGVWTNAELREAVKHGAELRAVYWSHSFTRTMRPFSEYVERWYGKKRAYKAAGDPREFVAKLMLNSLYGKLALNATVGNIERVLPEGHYQQPRPCTVCEQCRNGSTCWRLIGQRRWGAYWVLPLNDTRAPDYVNLLWAVHVTSYARITLHRLMNPLREWLLYCDTDSIHLRDGAPEPATGAELGQLKLEAVHDLAQYRSPKEYRWRDSGAERWEYKSKGVPELARRGDSVFRPREEYWERNTTSYQQPLTFRMGAAGGRIAVWQDVEKQRDDNEKPKRNGARAWDYRELLRLLGETGGYADLWEDPQYAAEAWGDAEQTPPA